MRSELTFHQAVFGYDNGHHLLEASIRLSAEVRHFLAVATDLSGTPPTEGFEMAYTGLPLPGTSYYALFCTWLAPEVRRPGCVWGHVLLIDLPDLAELPDLSQLRNLFRRPRSRRLDEYRSRVDFQPQSRHRGTYSTSLAKTLGKAVLSALYLEPRKSIVFPASEAKETEDLVFGLWSQQWPRLRRSFRFSTGSFADRGRGGTPFDLQVSPKANRRAWQQRDEYLILDHIEQSDAASMYGPNAWILSSAVADLISPDVDGFRTFLRTYGVDVNEPREAFVRLARAFETLVVFPAADFRIRLSALGELFPGSSEALLLKEWLITGGNKLDAREDLAREWAIVSFLLTAAEAAPYAGVVVDVEGPAEMLWHGRKRAVLSLLAELVRQPERPLATAFAGAIAKAVRPTELRLISEESPELIPLFLRHRPELAIHPDVWRLPIPTQWRIHEALSGLSLPPKVWGEIVGTMLQAGSSTAVRDAVKKAGRYAIEGALRWAEDRAAKEDLPSQVWQQALAVSAADRLKDSELSSAALAFCGWCLPPDTVRRSLHSSRLDVQRLAEELEEVPKPLRLHAAFLLVSLGLRDGQTQGATLLAKGFFAVYDALASRDYSSDSWLLLSPELPDLGWWKDWDRCEKLRQATVRTFPDHDMVASKLLAAAVGPKQVEIVKRIYPNFLS